MSTVRRRITWFLWALASAFALWHGVRLAFFRVATQGTIEATAPGEPPGREVIEPAFVPEGIPILIVLIVMYAGLGGALYARRYGTFRLLAGLHIALSLVAVSVGGLFLPSSALLLLAIVVSVGLPARNGERTA